VHLELPSEVALPSPTPINSSGSPRSSQDSSRSANHIPRKPLPTSAKVPPPSSQRAGPRSPLAENASLADRPAYTEIVPPWRPDGSGFIPSESSPEPPPRVPPTSPGLAPPHRRPIGPRPMLGSRKSAGEKDLPPLPGEDLLSTGGSPRRFAEISHSPPKSANFRGVSPPSPTNSQPGTSGQFFLDIIRRDPSSGSQWNVGRVSSYQVDPVGQDGSSHDDAGRHQAVASINVQIETSGYAKFRARPQRQSLDLRDYQGSTPSLASSLGRAGYAGPLDEFGGSGGGSTAGGTFSRQVVMSYTKKWTSNIRDKFREMNDHGRSKGRHRRHESMNSVGSADSSDSTGGGSTSPTLITHPGHGLRPNGYVFNSPWDGRCEFRTGNGGKSLQCRHIIQLPATAYNPLSPPPTAKGSSSKWAYAPMVSELRFNLPSTELFKGREGSTSHQLHGHFSKLLRLDHRDDDDSSDEDDGLVSPFDLNLGREKAGGGNRGTRVKLGKLIIHDEGLKMLDLVVATNIGIWWGSWERVL
jgi:hypothetical protein